MNDKRAPNDKLSGMKLGEAIQRLAQTDPAELAMVTQASMNDGDIEKLIGAFEAAAQFDESGIEYWSARDLQSLFEYSDSSSKGNGRLPAKRAIHPGALAS